MSFFNIKEKSHIEKLNFLERIYGILFKPSITIKNLIYKPKLIYPFFAKVFGIIIFYILHYSIYERHIRELVKNQLTQANTGFSSQEINLAIKLAPKSVITSTIINNLISWLFIVFALYAIIKWVLKGKADMPQLISITGYAYTPVLIYFFICYIAAFFTGQLFIDMSPALLIPSLKGTTIYGFLRSIDPFMVWQFVIIAIGLKMSSGLKKSDVYWVTAFIFIITIFINIDYYKLLN